MTFAQQGSEGHTELLGLTVAAVARRLGVAPATLRTWDRRYGLGPSQHTAGSHRRYTAADLGRLEAMRRLILAGVPPVDAARSVLAGVDGAANGLTVNPQESRQESRQENTAPGGGRVVAVPGGIPAARGLARAAMSLDSVACHDMVRESIDSRGVVWTWENLLVPVLGGIGERWQTSGTGIEVEHVLSEAVMVALGGFAQKLRHPINSRTVLLACAEHELHSLPLFAISAALAERRIGSRILGARVPADALIAAMRRTGPAAVFVWSQSERTGDMTHLGQLPEVRPAPLIIAAGRGWKGDVPHGIVRVHDLTEAVTRISTAVGL